MQGWECGHMHKWIILTVTYEHLMCNISNKYILLSHDFENIG